MDEKELRIRAITRMYYSNPKVQEAILKFSRNREVVPRYYEGFGKRPDSLQYVSDILGLVNKGATSFHSSEEIWTDPLKINSEMSRREMDEIRKGWDLLIDIDSPFLDCSKIATKLIIAALEQHGVKNYGIKFSGNKGFHIIVSYNAFPEEFLEQKTKYMFPEWPRAICEYLMDFIKRDYNRQIGDLLTDFEAIKKRTSLSEEDLRVVHCTSCNKKAIKAEVAILKCDLCSLEAERKNHKPSKRKLKCLNDKCAGFLELERVKEYYYCENCKDFNNKNLTLDSLKHPEFFEEFEGVSGEKIANLDLVLVAPRHLFRMPYSLHEKTCLSSVVISKSEIDEFIPKYADPLKVNIREYLPSNLKEEAKNLLFSALDWKKTQVNQDEQIEKKKYANYEKYDKIDLSGFTEDMFPVPIKKLLKGVEDGRKRALFILITFLRSLNFPPDYINGKTREWNNKNKQPLKEGYVKSQIDWHLKQKKKILPPNYDNDAFYKDLGLIEGKQNVKNPIVEVARKLRNRRNQ